jgi:hypothetical protein
MTKLLITFRNYANAPEKEKKIILLFNKGKKEKSNTYLPR